MPYIPVRQHDSWKHKPVARRLKNDFNFFSSTQKELNKNRLQSIISKLPPTPKCMYTSRIVVLSLFLGDCFYPCETQSLTNCLSLQTALRVACEEKKKVKCQLPTRTLRNKIKNLMLKIITSLTKHRPTRSNISFKS